MEEEAEKVMKEAKDKALELCLVNNITNEKVIILVETAYLIGRIKGLETQ